jgi:hypothetical protein
VIKLRIWKPLPYECSHHPTIEDALERFFEVYERYYEDEEMIYDQKMIHLVELFTIIDMTPIKAIVDEKRRKFLESVS